MRPVPIPAVDCALIARRAVEIARRNGPRARYGSRQGVNQLRPFAQEGQVGIEVPPQARHLMFQERGIRSYVQTALRGRIVPIRDAATGEIHFRYVNPRKVGKFRTPRPDELGGRRIIHVRDSTGRLLRPQILTRRHWSHPGLAPKNFMHLAIRQAVGEWMDQLDQVRVFEILRDAGVEPGEVVSLAIRERR